MHGLKKQSFSSIVANLTCPLALLCSWQVFGVCESPEQKHQSEAETSAAFSPVNVESREQHRQSSSGEVRPAAEQGQSLVKVNSPVQGEING